MNSVPKPEIRSRKVKSLRRRDGLIKFAMDVTSQNGEDGVLARIFQLIELKKQAFLVDVGAWDGKHLSNTYSLLWQDEGRKGVENQIKDEQTNPTLNKFPSWSGVLIEADDERYADLSRLYESKKGTVCINASVSVEGDMWNNPRSIVTLLRTHASSLPMDFDFLCVDIDGSDYWVWYDLLESKAYRPKVVCIEFNPTMPQDMIYIPPKSDSIRHGASLAALCEIAHQFSYVLVETTLFNAFFVTIETYKSYMVNDVPDTSIEVLHEMSMGTTMYQLYDGTIKLAGCKRMLWHRLAIDEHKMQMIPSEEREFPFAPLVDDFDLSHVIDMTAFFHCSTEPEAKRECSSKLLHYLESTGFCYVRGTSISQTFCKAALKSAHAFLETADESVRRSCLTMDRARRGYSPMNTENFASLIGQKRPNDLVRKFRIGARDRGPIVEYMSLEQPNVWPDESAWKDATTFRSNTEAYFQHISSVAETVIRAICDGLIQTDPNMYDVLQPLLNVNSSRAGNTSILTQLSYRPGSRHKGKNKGPLVAAHTDVGVITVLLFENHPNSCAKLQRSDGRGGWIDVNLPSTVPHDPVFVVNVADCFSEMCHGKLSSTLHRVVACRSGTQPRPCLAFFVGLDSKTELQMPMGSVTYEEWRKRRIDKSQATLEDSKTR